MVPITLVLLEEESSHGYELMERMEEEFGFEQINAGSVYRALRQMEKEGMVVSESEEPDPEACWLRYSITAWGEAYLEYLANVLGQYRKEVNLLFRVYKERCMPTAALNARQPG